MAKGTLPEAPLQFKKPAYDVNTVGSIDAPIKKTKVNSILDLPSFAFSIVSFPENTNKVLAEHGVSVEDYNELLKTELFQRTLADAVATLQDKGKDGYFATMNKAAAMTLLPRMLSIALQDDVPLKDVKGVFEILTQNAGLKKESKGAPAVSMTFMSTKGMHPAVISGLDHLTIEQEE